MVDPCLCRCQTILASLHCWDLSEAPTLIQGFVLHWRDPLTLSSGVVTGLNLCEFNDRITYSLNSSGGVDSGSLAIAEVCEANHSILLVLTIECWRVSGETDSQVCFYPVSLNGQPNPEWC